ncbi:hypothetical protein E1091_06980 [Micromonospora fluostatini]|uniref:Peptidase M48 domain-containing protein n=1 Tax=Micromonospora fluostatini TaxID=1629071 RepID=A0ABY2DJ88_9ACTN|nr:hypothetical protein E1091_06980 [Micromonospora fluostatini]
MRDPYPLQQDRPDDPAGPSTSAKERFAHRPPGYPNALVWLRAGVLRDWRGVLGAFLATWFYVPLGLLLAFWGAIGGAVAGLLSGADTAEAVPDVLRDAPLLGALLDGFLGRTGGALGGFTGFVFGALSGFLLVLVLPWRAAFDEPANLLTGLAGMVAAAALIGAVYTVYRVLWEPRLLAVSGARQLSRREAERLGPILADCARALDLPSLPRLLIEDDPVLTNARAYARHVVVTTSLLTESDEEIAALLSHELVHWRTGDEVTGAFVRGVGLPLVLVHAVPTWLMRTFPHPATNLAMFLFFWPVLVTMRYLVLPLHARDVRAAEYRADAGAVLAGHAEGMRDMLERRKSFESGRSGWDEAVCATHPPSELRLDRLERLTSAAQAGAATSAGVADGTDRSVAEDVPVSAADLFAGPGAKMSPRTVLVAGVLALACGFGGTVLTLTQWVFFRPAAAVDGYFSALADRDARAVLELVGSADGTTDTDLLARLVRGQGYQPPEDVAVTSIHRDGDLATATVDVTIADQRLTTTLSLRREDSATLGLFHRWRLDAAPGTLTVPPVTDGLSINGVPVPVAPEGASLELLPGAYTVDGQQNPLATTAPQTIVVVPGEPSAGTVFPEPVLNPEAQATAEEQVRRYLDTCATLKVAAPPGCPFSHYASGEVRSIAWKIETYPRIALELTSPTTARVVTLPQGQGTAQATGTAVGFVGTTPFTDDDEFGVEGFLSVVDGTLTFQPSDE